MSQLVGRKLPQTPIDQQNWTPASAELTDHHGNAGIHTIAFGPKLTSYIDSTNPALMYFGDAASGTGAGVTGWCICRATIVAGGVSKYEWAYVPASGAVPAKYSGFDHIWNNRAALNYA